MPPIPSLPVWPLAPGRSLALDRPRILAILNVTPDSFSDGGELTTARAAAVRAGELAAEGADALDVGGESTRPGAQRVDEREQVRRVVPAVRAIRDAGIDLPITVDTTRAAVAAAALDAGADAVNDVSGATEDPELLPVAASRRRGVILMHRLRPPDADRYSDRYGAPPDYSAAGGVVPAVESALAGMLARAAAAGIEPPRVVLDPGLGFGKSVEQNLELIAALPAMQSRLGAAVLSAASRKSFVGRVSGVDEPARRVAGSITIAVAHALAGVRLFRVHDVRPHREALETAFAIARAAPADA